MNKKIPIIFCVVLILGILMNFFGPGIVTLDMKFYYTGDDARGFFYGLSEQKQSEYFVNEVLDLFFLCAYSTLSLLFLSRLFPKNIWIKLVSILPGTFDLIETGTLLLLLKERAPKDALNWLGMCTALKWTAGALVFFLFSLGMIQRWQREKWKWML